MNIQIVEISKLKRAEYNPRKELTSEDPEYQQLKKSILEFGYVVPIVINKDYTVIRRTSRANSFGGFGIQKYRM